ncbi:MAG: hypothetical protein MH252_20300 [Thermosynechococcaceae cyanobacterium MS004]|nr:hypothetical protein [Thermosynechococcaceae cyanobacterium MS004]
MDENLQDLLASPTLHRLRLFTYLIPVFGMVPAVWTMTQGKRDRQYRPISRLALGLGSLWLLGYFGLNSALSPSESGMSAQMSLMLIQTVFTSGYFVLCLGLMVRLWKQRATGLSDLSQSLKVLSAKSLP